MTPKNPDAPMLSFMLIFSAMDCSPLKSNMPGKLEGSVFGEKLDQSLRDQAMEVADQMADENPGKFFFVAEVGEVYGYVGAESAPKTVVTRTSKP